MDGVVITDARASVARRDDGTVEVEIEDNRPESWRLFEALDENQLDAVASDAWKIGLRALGSALAQAEEARLADAGKRLVEEVDQRVKHLLEVQQKGMLQTLESYFDPSKGQLSQKLSTITDADGELARRLEKHVALDGSTLAKTLAAQVGAESPLLKRLSPTDSEGIIKQLEQRFEETLANHQKALAAALDPQAEDGPVRRFLFDLQERLQKAGADQTKMVKEVAKALDANDENSLLSQLNRDVRKANERLLHAINPENEESPMAVVRATLERMIKKHMESNQELLEKSRKEQTEFHKEVRAAIARIEKQKEADERTTFGGFDFEDSVTVFIGNVLKGGPFTVEAKGNSTGLIRNSKKGDQVVRFMGDHAFAESGLVVESKRDSSYTASRALEELEAARNNRDCQAGLFVLNSKSAPKGFPSFARYGQDILVTWDPEDPKTDSYLHAAILAGLALVTRANSSTDEGNIAALHDIGQRVTAEIERLGKMQTWTGNILRDATKIEEEIEKAKKKLNVLNKKGKEVLAELYNVIADEAELRHDPIEAPADGLSRAQAALGRSPEKENEDEWSEKTHYAMDAAIAARRTNGDDEEE